jgi:hypothetical protein
MGRMRDGDSIIKSLGSREVSMLERLADRPGAERETIINFTDGTRMSVASTAEPKDAMGRAARTWQLRRCI